MVKSWICYDEGILPTHTLCGDRLTVAVLVTELYLVNPQVYRIEYLIVSTKECTEAKKNHGFFE